MRAIIGRQVIIGLQADHDVLFNLHALSRLDIVHSKSELLREFSIDAGLGFDF